MPKVFFAAFLFLISATFALAAEPDFGRIRGWNILSDSHDDAMVTIAAAAQYDINHLQLSHHVVMDLRDLRKEKSRSLVTNLTRQAHKAGIKEVVVWDHALYDLRYYPKRFFTPDGRTLDFDNPDFWAWFKNDYREMLGLVPEIDGLVLTFIETGARAERQHSVKLATEAEKLAAVVDAIAGVVCGEYGKKLYIRTFAYDEKEYAVTIGCLEHVKNRDVILMMKEVPHDFFLLHPSDKFAGLINRPTLIEFDTGGEFNGQGITANTWPEYVLGRWSDFARRPNVVGYVARTDRYGTTRIIGTPNEILLMALCDYTADPTTTADKIYDRFISEKYGDNALPYVKPAFARAFEIATSVFYTLGSNTANHSALSAEDYSSPYHRHVTGKWLADPTVFIKHGVNREFHYWKDVVNHIAPARHKGAGGPINKEIPEIFAKGWITPAELMNEEYLRYIMAEKAHGVKLAAEALADIEKGKKEINPAVYAGLHSLFERTLITAQLHEATWTAYLGYRVYARGEAFRTPWLKQTISEALARMRRTLRTIKEYDKPTPRGEWVWHKDAEVAERYYKMITEGSPHYGDIIFVP